MRTVLKDYWWRSGGAAVDANRQFVIDNSLWFHDFNLLTGDEDDAITSDVVDLTGNGYDLEDASPAATGGAKIGKANYFETEVTCAKLKQTTTNPNVLMFKQGVDSLFNDTGDFEYHILVGWPEGYGSIDLLGFVDNVDSGILFSINSVSPQILLFSGSVSLGNETAWESLSVWPTQAQGLQMISFRINKTGAINPKIYVNGVERVTTRKSGWGAFSNWTPGAFDSGNLKPALGGYNVAVSLQNRTDINFLIARDCLTNLLTDEERLKVFQAFTTFE